MNDEDNKLINKLLSNKKIVKKTLNKISISQSKNLDKTFRTEHDHEFEKRNCLKCANCCKTTSPIFRTKDIHRISSHLKIKEQVFIDKYLKLDSDNDLVLKKAPCYFLNEDNTCKIYQYRPLACKEYPHTNRKNMYQILDLTVKNSTICPAVANIVLKIVKINYQ